MGNFLTTPRFVPATRWDPPQATTQYQSLSSKELAVQIVVPEDVSIARIRPSSRARRVGRTGVSVPDAGAAPVSHEGAQDR